MRTAFAQKQLEMFKDTVSSMLTESQLITTAGEKTKQNSKLHLCYKQTTGLMGRECTDYLNNLSATAKLCLWKTVLCNAILLATYTYSLLCTGVLPPSHLTKNRVFNKYNLSVKTYKAQKKPKKHGILSQFQHCAIFMCTTSMGAVG